MELLHTQNAAWKPIMPHFQPGSFVVDSYSTNHKILHPSLTSQIHQHLHKHCNCTYHEAVQSNLQLTVTANTCTLTLFFHLHLGDLNCLFLWDFLTKIVHILLVSTWILHTIYLNFLVKLLCMKCLPLSPYFCRLIPNTMHDNSPWCLDLAGTHLLEHGLVVFHQTNPACQFSL